MTDGLLVFGLNASRGLGESIAAKLGVGLSAHEEREFEDGKHKACALVNVRGRDRARAIGRERAPEAIGAVMLRS